MVSAVLTLLNPHARSKLEKVIIITIYIVLHSNVLLQNRILCFEASPAVAYNHSPRLLRQSLHYLLARLFYLSE